MRNNSKDRTIERNLAQKWRFLIGEFELVKAGRHPQFRFRRTSTGSTGPTGRPFTSTTTAFSRRGPMGLSCPGSGDPSGRRAGRCPALRKRYWSNGARVSIGTRFVPYCGSPPGAYPSALHHLCHQPSAQPEPVEQENGTVQATDYQDRAGELGHLDSHHLSRDLIVGTKQRYYLVAVLDACTRLAWAEVTGDIKSLSAMFAALKSINFLHAEYGLRFEALLTDNGPEMASPRNLDHHPMERMLQELGIKHPLHPPLSASDQREGGAVLAYPERGPAGRDHLRDGGRVAG